jgi:hypothetical protein
MEKAGGAIRRPSLSLFVVIPDKARRAADPDRRKL